MSVPQPTPATEFPPVNLPEHCKNCFYATGIEYLANLTAAELRAGVDSTRYRRAYAGFCAAAAAIEQTCAGRKVQKLPWGDETPLIICSYLSRLPSTKGTLSALEAPDFWH